jgi:transcriptional regulator with XRE-family HTH domain
MPAIIDFLSYNPLPPATTLAKRLVRGRMSLGLSRKTAARRMSVDPTTLAKWERGEREPAGDFAARVLRFLGKAKGTMREPGGGAKPAVTCGNLGFPVIRPGYQKPEPRRTARSLPEPSP